MPEGYPNKDQTTVNLAAFSYEMQIAWLVVGIEVWFGESVARNSTMICGCLSRCPRQPPLRCLDSLAEDPMESPVLFAASHQSQCTLEELTSCLRTDEELRLVSGESSGGECVEMNS